MVTTHQTFKLLIIFALIWGALIPLQAIAEDICNATPSEKLRSILDRAMGAYDLPKLNYKLLPPLPGTKPNIPVSLRSHGDFPIHFGIESEFTATTEKANTKMPNLGTQNFLKYYHHGLFKDEHSAMSSRWLRKTQLSSTATQEEKLLWDYLPDLSKKEIGKEHTQEIPFDVLPNYETFKTILDLKVKYIGKGSMQAMVSIPGETLSHLGKAELSGLTHLSSELTTLTAMVNPTPYHAFFHPYNHVVATSSEARIQAQAEMWYFTSGNHTSTLSMTDFEYTKYKLGITPRYDLIAKSGNKETFFFEIRGCKENPECLKKYVSQLVNIYENEIIGCKKYAVLSDFISPGLDDFIECSLWKNFAKKDEIKSAIHDLYEGAYHKWKNPNRNFFYPLKDWEKVGPSLKWNPMQLQKIKMAQQKYIQALNRAWRAKNHESANKILVPALKAFAKDSGLLETLKLDWKAITGKDWDIEF